jgi:DNA-binding MarR family transcriptional regulator
MTARRRPIVGGRPLPRGATGGFDRVLDMLERRRLPPTEARLLLALIHREAAVGDLAETLERHESTVARAGRRLAARGLVRRNLPAGGSATVLSITPAGLATIRPLLSAAAWPAPQGA